MHAFSEGGPELFGSLVRFSFTQVNEKCHGLFNALFLVKRCFINGLKVQCESEPNQMKVQQCCDCIVLNYKMTIKMYVPMCAHLCLQLFCLSSD